MLKTNFDKKSKIWKGLKVLALYNPDISVGQAIMHALTQYPDHIGQISDNNGMVVTNSKIKLQTIRIARNLLKMGYENGNVVGIVARNHHDLSAVVFACLTIGTPVNIMDVSSDIADISHMFGITKPKLIFCECIVVNKIREAIKNVGLSAPIFTFDGKYDNTTHMVEELFTKSSDDNLFCPPNIGDGTKSIAAIMCTSGTTGKSKGVCLTHAAILDNANFMTLTSSDVFFGFSSMNWISGFGCLISATLNGATRVITTESFSPELWCRIAEQHKVTSTILQPCYLSMLLQCHAIRYADLSTIREFWSGGYSVANVLCEKMKKYLPNAFIFPSYGMTEMCGIISVNVSEEKLGSVGQIVKNVEVKLIDEYGSRCSPGQIGEICCRARYQFLGYYKDEETTKASIDENGWIKSGDIGYVDNDGFLFIIDRKKDIIVYMGHKISPVEIEGIILKHPGVVECCAVGIPDLNALELLAVLIIKSKDLVVTEKDITMLVRENLPDWKQIRGGVYFVDFLPVTSSGKIKRKIAAANATVLYKSSCNYDSGKHECKIKSFSFMFAGIIQERYQTIQRLDVDVKNVVCFDYLRIDQKS